MMVTLPRLRCSAADVGIEFKDDAPPELREALDEYFGAFLKPERSAVGSGLLCVCGERITAPLIGSFTWGLSHGEGFCGECGRPARAYHRPRDRHGEILSMSIVLVYLPTAEDPSFGPREDVYACA